MSVPVDVPPVSAVADSDAAQLLTHTRPPGGKWFFVTNQKNLQYLLASGMILPKGGYGKKYYLDTLDGCAGYLPLFKTRIPRQAIELVVSEKTSLFAVVLEIDLDLLTGPVLVPQVMTGVVSKAFPLDNKDIEEQIFVKGPLPAHWIKKIIVADKQRRLALERDAGEVLNVPLGHYPLTTGKTLLKGSVKDHFSAGLPAGYQTESRHDATGNAVGGMLAALARFITAGADGVAINALAFDTAFEATPDTAATPDGDNAVMPVVAATEPPAGPKPGAAPIEAEALFRCLPQWMQALHSDNITEERGAQMFWRAVDALIGWHGSDRVGNGNDRVLSMLEGTAANMTGSDKDHALEFLTDLQDLHGVGDSSADQLFARHSTPVRRAFLLLLLVTDINHLQALYTEQQFSALTLKDFLAAAILVGVRQGWRATAVADRQSTTVVTSIQHRMALVSQCKAGADLCLGALPAREPALRELFAQNPAGQYSRRQMQAAVTLARAMKWDCLETSITLPDDSYHLNSRAGKLTIITGADVRVDTRVKVDQFLELIDSDNPGLQLTEKIRAQL